MSGELVIDMDLHIQVCRVVCCGESNFQQHLSSKRHLRRLAHAGVQALDMQTPPHTDEAPPVENGTVNPTYIGLQAQCRNYCKQVGGVLSIAHESVLSSARHL